ncbi:MAG TPA: hypothetical protein VHR86_07535, partial [Armatimonadota bacterium]|nr:hypothetical protein [Armatimonadota bacterium]
MEAIIQRLPPTDERVAWNTPAAINERLRRDLEESISSYAGASREELTARIHALNREWDIERVLETNAGIVILTSLFLGTRRDRRWLA